jgi:molybdopterin-containing oxidoreductase family molybdopterin binding subunit
MCYVGCSIRVKVENGIVVGIEGDPNNPQNRGKMCAKGKAGFMNLYNPNRVKAPLKRTNPKKGLNEDPGWQEISWEEAMETIADKLLAIRDNPKKLYVQAWEINGDPFLWMINFGTAFGTPHVMGHASATCGKVIHPVEYFSGGGFHQQPDLHYSKYCILVGTQFAIAARGAFNHIARDMAEARARGMKLVVVDPIGGYAGSKADEWIPILPGTDSAFALSVLHVLLNELGLYDETFLKHRTNAPYLVGADGRYVREAKSGKPMVFDAADGTAKPFDDPSLSDPAITGDNGGGGRPAFDLLKAHVGRYPPEKTQGITTIPAQTLRRIVREFGEAANVGATIKIEGVELPYRPVCVDWARGPQGHKHGFHQSWPLKLINIVLGAVNVPGGILSTVAAGKRPFHWWPEGGTDGMLEEGGHVVPLPHPKAFPGRTPTKPIRMDLAEFFPMAPHFHTLLPITAENPEHYGLSYRLEVMLHNPTNSVLGSFGDLRKVERFYQSISFIAGFAIEINETNLFDDIILPFPSYLERFDFLAGTNYNLPHCGKEDWLWHVRQQVVKPPEGIRPPQEVIIELAARVGILEDFYRLTNHAFRLKHPHDLKPDKCYAITEIVDTMARAWFGEEHGLEWFKENGLIRIPRDVDEVYIGPFLQARVPIYLEHFVQRGEELRKVMDQMGIEWDYSDYTPLSEWLPCPAYDAVAKGNYDFIAVHYKLPFVYGGFGNENPWINELCERNKAYSVLMNEAAAKAQGLRDGDEVWLESPVNRVKAKLNLTQCIHPRVVGIAGHFGHWSEGMPISRGKGISFNSLLPTDLEHIDKISTALDHCVEVRIFK